MLKMLKLEHLEIGEENQRVITRCSRCSSGSIRARKGREHLRHLLWLGRTRESISIFRRNLMTTDAGVLLPPPPVAGATHWTVEGHEARIPQLVYDGGWYEGCGRYATIACCNRLTVKRWSDVG